MQKLTTLFMATSFVVAASAQPCSQLFFSEYIVGSSNNKAVEVFNPTNDTVNLSGYKIVNFHNGYTTATSAYIFNLAGIILPHGTFAVCRKSASDALKSRCQDSTTSSSLNFNGDDAIALIYHSDTLDIIGQIGEDPGSYWHFGRDSTKNQTLVRKAFVNQGSRDSSVSFHQWNGFPKDDFSHLGSHSFIPCDSTIIDTTSSPDSSVVVIPVDSIPLYPIETISTENENGVADSLNVHCAIRGVVYGVNMQKTGLKFIISDHTGWIQIYSASKKFGYAVHEGDSVFIQGKVDQNFGMTRMNFLDTVIRISSNNTLQSPTEVTYLSEQFESALVRVNDVRLEDIYAWTNSGSSFSVLANHNTLSYKICIDSLTSAYGMAVPTYSFDVVGWISQNDTCNPLCLSNYAINPRYSGDIMLHETSSISELEKPQLFAVFPNPFSDRLFIEPNIPFQLFDMLGRETDTNNLSQIAVGTYILKTTLGSIRVVKK